MGGGQTANGLLVRMNDDGSVEIVSVRCPPTAGEEVMAVKRADAVEGKDAFVRLKQVVEDAVQSHASWESVMTGRSGTSEGVAPPLLGDSGETMDGASDLDVSELFNAQDLEVVDVMVDGDAETSETAFPLFTGGSFVDFPLPLGGGASVPDVCAVDLRGRPGSNSSHSQQPSGPSASDTDGSPTLEEVQRSTTPPSEVADHGTASPTSSLATIHAPIIPVSGYLRHTLTESPTSAKDPQVLYPGSYEAMSCGQLPASTYMPPSQYSLPPSNYTHMEMMCPPMGRVDASMHPGMMHPGHMHGKQNGRARAHPASRARSFPPVNGLPNSIYC
eukprot:TRINITY_DN3200_c0_g1_i2.p1 TRINITY_DN3200_c0_g1~~TRINITY_DN3200_c0_g1_i2.p1  ORF type:complete len:331 (+),score=52.91 TRINITY_DN3200_c0_g1_i2:72-1064(+)